MDTPQFDPGQHVTVTVLHHDATAVLRISGEIDMANRDTVAGPLLECLDEASPVVVDLSEVAFIGSSGLNVLVQAQRKAMRLGIALRIIANTSLVLRPMQITGLLGHLPVSASMPEALGEIGGDRSH